MLLFSLSRRLSTQVQTPRSAIVQATAHDPRNWLYPWAIFDDGNVTPQLLSALRHCSSQHTWMILEDIRRRKIRASSAMLALLIQRATDDENLELSLRYLHLLKSNLLVNSHIPPIQSIILLAAKQNQSRLAIDIALWAERAHRGQLSKRVWVACLASATATLFADGILVSWHRVRSHPTSELTEGLSTAVAQASERLCLVEISEEVECRGTK